METVDTLNFNLIHRCCVGDVLTRNAEHLPDRLAVAVGDEDITYRELNRRANAVGHGLLSLGLRRQDRVAIMIGNRWEFLAAYFGCAKAGLIALPINTGLGSDELLFILNDSGARIMVAEQTFADAIGNISDQLNDVEELVLTGDRDTKDLTGLPVSSLEALCQADPSPVEVFVDDRDILHCLYTSGTTARPKGALVSHVSVQLAAMSAALQHGFRRGYETAVQPIVLPLFHTAALNTLLLPTFVAGGAVIVHQGFDSATTIATIEKRRATHILLLPKMWADLLAHEDIAKRDLSSMRLCQYAMAPMPPERIERMRQIFSSADILLSSGQTEFTPPTVFQWPENQFDKASSWGPAVSTTDVRIMAPNGDLLPRGQEGEIVYRGPQCMQRYWNDQKATEDVFAHGWFHSGDLGYIEEDGVVWFTDRSKDLVKTGGENVSSVEVERVILTHPAVAECAVVGLPHETWGEAVTAMVIPQSGSDVAQNAILALCRRTLARFKVPKRVEFVSHLPKTSTGKIQKHRIRAAHADDYR